MQNVELSQLNTKNPSKLIGKAGKGLDRHVSKKRNKWPMNT